MMDWMYGAGGQACSAGFASTSMGCQVRPPHTLCLLLPPFLCYLHRWQWCIFTSLLCVCTPTFKLSVHCMGFSESPSPVVGRLCALMRVQVALPAMWLLIGQWAYLLL